MAQVQTVTGPIDADALGRTLVHEHSVITYPGEQYERTTKWTISAPQRRLASCRCSSNGASRRPRSIRSSSTTRVACSAADRMGRI